MLTVTSEVATTPTIFLNLWKHECNRVIADRFTNQQDKDWFEKAIKQVVEEDFDAETSGLLEAEPYFVDFMRDAPEPTGKEKSASNPRQLLPFPKCITLPYLPVYNAHLCIIRTLIFDLFFRKKRFHDKYQELKLSFFHLINKSWEFINNMFTTISN